MRDFGLCHIVRSIPYYPDLMKDLPVGWKYRGKIPEDIGSGEIFTCPKKDLAVISSLETMKNGKNYIHISLSHNDKMPNWDTVKTVKILFIGDDTDAFIYFPVKDEYINLMPYCLHLWSEQ